MWILVSIIPHPPITHAPASVVELRATRGGMWAMIESVLIVVVGSDLSRLTIIRMDVWSRSRGRRLGDEGEHVLHIELRLIHWRAGQDPATIRVPGVELKGGLLIFNREAH